MPDLFDSPIHRTIQRYLDHIVNDESKQDIVRFLRLMQTFSPERLRAILHMLRLDHRIDYGNYLD